MNRLPYNRSYVAFQPIRVCVSIHYTPYGKGFILYWKDDFILIKEPDWRRVPWICLLIRGERILTRRGGFKKFLRLFAISVKRNTQVLTSSNVMPTSCKNNSSILLSYTSVIPFKC